MNGVFVGKPDGYLVGAGTGWEVDSREQHEAPDLLEATLDRDKRFHRGAGLSLEHETPRRFRRDPSAFVSRLFAEADRRAELGILEPEGLELRACGPLLC